MDNLQGWLPTFIVGLLGAFVAYKQWQLNKQEAEFKQKQATAAAQKEERKDGDAYFEKKADDLEERLTRVESRLEAAEKTIVRYEMAWKYIREVGGISSAIERTAQDIIDGRIAYSNPSSQ